MSQNIEKSIIFILRPKPKLTPVLTTATPDSQSEQEVEYEVVGTGFIIAPNLAVTCAHVVMNALNLQKTEPGSDKILRVRYIGTTIERPAMVCETGWSPTAKDDVAFLALDGPPPEFSPVRLGSGKNTNKHPFTSLGYMSSSTSTNERVIEGTINGVINATTGHKLLQLSGDEIEHGFSGAPILDKKTDRVVGMVSFGIKRFENQLGHAVSADTIVSLYHGIGWQAPWWKKILAFLQYTGQTMQRWVFWQRLLSVVIAFTVLLIVVGWAQKGFPIPFAATAVSPEATRVFPANTIAPSLPTATRLSPSLTPTPIQETHVSPILSLPLPRKAAPARRSTSDGMEMVFVPGGAFTMGALGDDALVEDNEKPAHPVLLESFWIDRAEVTNAMYAQCVAQGACQAPANQGSYTHTDYYTNPAYAGFPVIHVTWEDANAYCHWAGKRLPSEAEWEKAARGLDGRTYPWGDAKPDCTRATFGAGDQFCTTDVPASGSYPDSISPYGALDMAGSTWEWVSDWYSPSYYRNLPTDTPTDNPSGPPDGLERVLRGGSWNEQAAYLRSTNRGHAKPDFAGNNTGIRCAASDYPEQFPVISVPSPHDGMQQVLVPAGSFTMGSDAKDTEDEGPQHMVTLDAFWIDRTEITNAMFALFIQDTNYQTEAERNRQNGRWYNLEIADWDSGADWQHPYGPDSSISGQEDYPVAQISWNDAAAYCEWAGRRLPTEAEWEKAARGIDGRRYPWGDTEITPALANFADVNLPTTWSAMNVDDGYRFAAPVSAFSKNVSPYGALAMAGNQFEWVADGYDSDYYTHSPHENPSGPPRAEKQVARGGSWAQVAADLRTTGRLPTPTDYAAAEMGFRCAQSIGKPTETTAFVSEAPGNQDIFIINADGSGLMRLTDNWANDYHPVFSPDGNTIAFISEREGSAHLYLMNSDGNNTRRVPGLDIGLDYFSWSPDGQWLAFESREAGNWDIYKIRVDGGEPIQLTHGMTDENNPSWSPDGKEILFVSNRMPDGLEADGMRMMYIMNAEQGDAATPTLVPTPGGDFYIYTGDWFADNAILMNAVLEDDRSMFLISRDGSSPVQKIANVDYDRYGSMAPDGRRFVFVSSPHMGQLFISSTEAGSKSVPLETNMSSSEAPDWSPKPGDERIVFSALYDSDLELYTTSPDRPYPLRLTFDENQQLDPHISPDGRQIAFSVRPKVENGNHQICITSASTPRAPWKCLTETANDTSARYPAWSPDGKHLVFSYSVQGSNWDLFRIAIDGSNPVQLTRDPANDFMPAWSPDGATIYFASERSGNNDLYRIDAADGNHVGLLTSNSQEFDWSPSPSPDGQQLAFTSSRNKSGAYYTQVYLLDLNSGQVTPLVDNNASNPLVVWSWDGRRVYFESSHSSGIPQLYLTTPNGEESINLTKNNRASGF